MTLTFGSANGIEYFALLQNTAIVQETYNTLILESFNRHKINIRVDECFRLIEAFLTFCLNSCLSSDQLTWSEIFHTHYKKSSQISSHGLGNLKIFLNIPFYYYFRVLNATDEDIVLNASTQIGQYVKTGPG